MYRLTFRLAILGIALALAAVSVAPILVGPLLLYFCALWVVWILCVCAATPWPGVARLSALWALIDLGVLVAFLAMARNVATSAYGSTEGADIALFVAFGPVALPLGFVITYWDVALPSVVGLLESTLGHFRADLIDAWLVMSTIAAVQCSILILVSWAIRSIRGNRKNPERASNHAWSGRDVK
jgi:hypothetical protein